MGALDDITASLTADAKSFAMRKVVDYVAADPIGRLPQALTIIDKLDVRDILLPHRKAVRAIIESPDNNWNQLIRGLWEDVDPEVLRTFLQNVVVNGSIVGYPIQQRAAEEHDVALAHERLAAAEQKYMDAERLRLLDHAI